MGRDSERVDAIGDDELSAQRDLVSTTRPGRQALRFGLGIVVATGAVWLIVSAAGSRGRPVGRRLHRDHTCRARPRRPHPGSTGRRHRVPIPRAHAPRTQPSPERTDHRLRAMVQHSRLLPGARAQPARDRRDPRLPIRRPVAGSGRGVHSGPARVDRDRSRARKGRRADRDHGGRTSVLATTTLGRRSTRVGRATARRRHGHRGPTATTSPHRGDLGAVEAAVPALLAWYGAPIATALSAVLLYRAIGTFLPAAAGALSIPALRASARSRRSARGRCRPR